MPICLGNAFVLYLRARISQNVRVRTHIKTCFELSYSHATCLRILIIHAVHLLNKYICFWLQKVTGEPGVVQSLSRVQLCDPMDYSMPGFPVLQYLLEFAQTHVCWIGDAIQPSHPFCPLLLLLGGELGGKCIILCAVLVVSDHYILLVFNHIGLKS